MRLPQLPTTSLGLYCIGCWLGANKPLDWLGISPLLPLSIWVFVLSLGHHIHRYRVWHWAMVGLASLACGYRFTMVRLADLNPEIPLTPLSFQARIVDAPDVRSTSIQLTLMPLDFPDYPHRILARVDRYPNWEYNQTVQFSGQLEAAEALDGFDYPNYLRRFGITAVSSRPALRLVAPAQLNAKLVLFRLRSWIETKYNQLLPEPEASLMSGIMIGSRRSIPEEIQADLRTTGTSHIVAISGSNVTIALSVLGAVLPLRTAKQFFIATLMAGSLISIMTGASSAVIRGAGMAILVRFLRFRERRQYSASLILISATGMLAFNPLLISYDPGFQLSFGAFTGLTIFSQPLGLLFQKLRLTKLVPGFFKAAFIETTAASLGTAPVTYFIYHTVNWLGLLVNPLILWLVPIAMLAGGLILLLGSIPLLNHLISLCGWSALNLLLKIITWGAQLGSQP